LVNVDVSDVAEKNSAATEEMSASVQTLTDMAREFQALATKFNPGE
jgi:methyl-accepting chemotaxis protein